MDKKQDLRVIKTRESLQNAFFQLLGDKSFYDIKIKEICERAKINKTTFYDHFKSKHDLYYSKLEDATNTIIAKLNELETLNTKDSFSKNCRILVMEAVNYLFYSEEHFKNAVRNKENSIMLEREIRNYVKYFIMKWLKKETVDFGVPKNILCEFYSGAFSSVILWWIREDNKISKEKLCDYIVFAMKL